MPSIDDFSTLVQGRWQRLMNRMVQRRAWHDNGILLWVLQRPSLRFLPCPYPNVSNCKDWALQVESMQNQKIWPAAHLRRALRKMDASALSECLWLRDRLGFRMAFLEDPMIGNILLLQGFRGQKSAIHREAMKHAKEIAEKQRKSGKEMEYVKELIGPRGGLPTLKKDLVALATLLHLPVEDKDTVEILKDKIRGPLATVVGSLKDRDKRSRASQDAAKEVSTKPASQPPAKAKAPPPQPSPYSAPSEGVGATEIAALEARLHQSIERQDLRVQGMLKQMMDLMQMTPQALQGMPANWTLGPMPETPDFQMQEEDAFDQTAREMGVSREEVLQLNAEHMAELAEEQLKAGPNER